MLTTTLNIIRKANPCGITPRVDGTLYGLRKLMAFLGKTKTDDCPIDFATIVASNGVSDAAWCLEATRGCEHEVLLFKIWCARQLEPLIVDPRSLEALQIAEKVASKESEWDSLEIAYSLASAASADIYRKVWPMFSGGVRPSLTAAARVGYDVASQVANAANPRGVISAFLVDIASVICEIGGYEQAAPQKFFASATDKFLELVS